MFFENLKENYDKLTVSEQEVIDFLMKQEKIEKITLKEIKQEIFISSSTVIRACKKLGYETYNDLRYELKLSKEKSTLKTNYISTFEHMKEQLSVEFLRTISILSEKDFNKFSDIIINARRVFCVGIGSSYVPIIDFNRKLKLINIWANDYYEQYSIARIPDISTEKDVIIVFSLGGKNIEVNNSLLEAKKNGTKILAITSLATNKLAKISDHIIKVYDAPKTRDKIRSRLMLNLVGTLLFENIINKINNRD